MKGVHMLKAITTGNLLEHFSERRLFQEMKLQVLERLILQRLQTFHRQRKIAIVILVKVHLLIEYSSDHYSFLSLS